MSAGTARVMIESIIRYARSDIVNMRKFCINAGYPICLLTMVCIEAVANAIYHKKGKSEGSAVELFFNEYMSKVRELYSIEFSEKIERNGKFHPGSLGRLMYTYLRCKLGHNANAIPGLAVDAQPETYHLHLRMKDNEGLLIHGYAFFDDFLNALEYVYIDADKNEDNFLKQLFEGIDYQNNQIKEDIDNLKKILNSGTEDPYDSYPYTIKGLF